MGLVSFPCLAAPALGLVTFYFQRDNVAARIGRAWSLARIGRRQEALAELERALAPGDPRLLGNLDLLPAGEGPGR